MNPGEFRYTTTINVKAETQQTDFGDFATTSTTTYTRFARVKWLPGSEQVNAEVVSLIKNVEFLYRFESVTELIDRIDTITYNSEIYFIKSVEFKGHANQQLVAIKAHTAEN